MNESTLPADDPPPLSGLKVLDLGQIYNGPYAGFLLAMGGADVIKVEPPGGEALRERGGRGGISYALGVLNSNKRGITLDLKSAEGRDLFLRLVSEADVLLENFAPGTMDRLGLGPSKLCELNPRLVYGSSTGYGLSGPSRDNLAMDLTIQANTGIMSVTGSPNQPPLKAGVALCDFLGGVHLYAAIVTALLQRSITGRGRVVEIAMQEAVYPVLTTNLTSMYLKGGEQPPRTGNSHPAGTSAPYGVYETTDGFIAIICVRESHWERLRQLMGRDDLATDPRFADQASRGRNAEAVDEAVAAWTRTQQRDRLSDQLREKGVPAAAVRTLPELIGDPHLHDRQMLYPMSHPELGDVVLPGSPLRFHGTRRDPPRPSPGLGEHNREVLEEWLALESEDVAQWLASGACG